MKQRNQQPQKQQQRKCYKKPTDSRNFEIEELERRAMRLFKELAKKGKKNNIDQDISNYFRENQLFPGVALKVATAKKRKYELIANSIKLRMAIDQYSSRVYDIEDISNCMKLMNAYQENNIDYEILTRYNELVINELNEAISSFNAFAIIEKYILMANIQCNTSVLYTLSNELINLNLYKYIN